MAFKNNLPKDLAKKAEHPIDQFREEMNRLFDSFFRGFDIEPFDTRGGVFSPKVDVVETETEIRVSAELPGMDEKEIDVSLAKDSLTIRGEKNLEKDETGKDYYRMERSYGAFSRTIPLPVQVDPEKVSAEFRKGVLSVVLPKAKEAVQKSKKISVKGS